MLWRSKFAKIYRALAVPPNSEAQLIELTLGRHGFSGNLFSQKIQQVLSHSFHAKGLAGILARTDGGIYECPTLKLVFLCREIRKRAMRAFGPPGSLTDLLRQTTRESSEVHQQAIAQLLIAQNLYVTKTVVPFLKYGAKWGPSKFSSNLMTYLSTEEGHDRLIEKAYRLVNDNCKWEDQVTFETKFLCALVQIAVDLGPTAIAIAIDHFEAGSSTVDHPVASFIRESGLSMTAADLIERHHAINVCEQHDDASLKLVEEIPYVSVSDALTVARFSRVLGVAQALLNQNLADKIIEHCK